MEEKYISKYHRREPVRKFNINQSMYDLVMNTNEKNMNMKYSNYFLKTKTFEELRDETDRLAIALHRDGVKEEEVVGTLLLTVPEVATSLLAINKIGAMSYWMDASLKPNDIIDYLNKHNVKELIAIEALLPMIEQIIDYTKLQRVIIVPIIETIQSKQHDDSRFVWYKDFINLQNDRDISFAKYDKEKPSIIVQSSGSTGKPKSIIHTDYNFNSEIEKMSYLDLPFYMGHRGFVCAPPWVIYGLVNSIYSGLVFGNETVYSLEPKEDMIYKNIKSFDFAYGVPVYYRYLINKIKDLKRSNKEEDKIELSAIEKELDRISAFISGGDKISENELIEWQQLLRTPMINGYGNNEVVGAAIVSPMFANKPGSIGVPVYGNEVKTIDFDTNTILPNGEIGELCISSDALFTEYLGNNEETKRVKTIIDGKQWVRTGDRGYIDPDGYVFLKGRTARLIIDKLGYKISPDNSENFIQKIDHVKECTVVGVSIAENDVVPMAFIELNDEFKNSEGIIQIVEEQCVEGLKEYERPKIFKEIEKIPHKSNGGKVDFLLLEQMAKEYVEEIKKTGKKLSLHL